MKYLVIILLLFLFSCEKEGNGLYEKVYVSDTVIVNDTVYIYIR